MRLAHDYRSGDGSDPLERIDAMDLLLAFSAVTYEDLGIVWGILNRMSLSEIARYVGLGSRQAAYKRLKAAISRNPWVAAFWESRTRSSRSSPGRFSRGQ